MVLSRIAPQMGTIAKLKSIFCVVSQHFLRSYLIPFQKLKISQFSLSCNMYVETLIT